jgi:chemotaxis protein methyltransferase CheR
MERFIASSQILPDGERKEEHQGNHAAQDAEGDLRTRGMILTDDEFRLFSELIYNESGITLKEAKRDFLQARLQKRIQASHQGSYYRYYKFVTDRMRGRRELLDLVDSLTINETSFFRNKPQFDLFTSIVLPDLKKRKEPARKLLLWSAGCSRGQEPYSIAMSVLACTGFPPGWDVKILASDISLRALESAQRGVYTEYDMECVEREHRAAFFVRINGNFQIAPHVRKMVVFDYHNLKNENGLTGVDVIFCRNVMIYFDLEEQKRLVEKFYRSLKPGGYLFLGHSETLQGISDKFTFVYHNRAAVYQKNT